MSTCRELVSNESLGHQVDLQRYWDLHKDGRRLIANWFKKAWSQRNCDPTDSFEPFIFTWIALNGWAANVTSLDRDRELIGALSVTPELCKDFSNFINGSNSEGYKLAFRFYHMWPIFKAQEIRRKNAHLWNPTTREETIKYYFDCGIEKYEPQCWRRHRDSNEDVPLDWPHTLAALYRVRCNLFHGEKGITSEMDRTIVNSAYQLLVHFLHDGGYFEH